MTEDKSIIRIDDETSCSFREMEISKQWNKLRNDDSYESLKEHGVPKNYGLICPICNKGLEIDQTMFMLITRGLLFPNTCIHKSCIKTDLSTTVIYLRDNYRTFRTAEQELYKKHQGWL
jgi:hypothetical protein